MVRYALAYACEGRHVFPCDQRPGHHEKAPLVEHGHLDATRDFPTISTWWKRWPTALIGSPVPADQVCVDIDPRKGATLRELAKTVGELPDTMAVFSGRNDGGVHLFFMRPVGADGGPLPLTDTKLAKVFGHDGYDLKTSAGYTILPPSLHPATRAPYFWRGDNDWPLDHPVHDLPEALAQLLIAPPARPRRPGDHLPSTGKLAGLVRRVRSEATVRNKVLYWAACRLVEGNYPESAYDQVADAALAAGLPHSEVNKTINSARKALS
jgi:hypothetical protein